MCRTVRVVLSLILTIAAASSLTAAPPVELGSRRELFVDGYLIDKLNGVKLTLSRPTDEGVAIRFDKPWEGLFCGYCTIIKDGELYRCYYRGMHTAGTDGSEEECTCYAESKDGIHWTKPNLGLFEMHGTRENNVILTKAAPATHNFSPFLDTRPDVSPSERFKALGGTSPKGLVGFTSADGIRWQKVREEPLFNVEGWAFDSQNVCFWSPTEQQYLLYFRKVPKGVRAVARATSKDFIHWSAPEMMTYSDTGTHVPAHHLYTNQTHPYFRAPHIYVATSARFMPNRQVLDAKQAEAVGVHPKYFGDTSDAILMTSRGGTRYDRTFPEGFLRPGIGYENWVSRTNYPALNIVQTGPTEMSFYANQNYGQPTAHLHRYSLRLDGLASVQAPDAGGEFTTKPLTFSGQQLLLNFSTSAAGGIRTEIQDSEGTPIPGFALEDAVETIGNEIERAVTWKKGSRLESLAGKTIRLRFVMRDADLFALRFE
ncbi:MAG: hypothetical protein AB7O26_16105 [Planctomycetaceae bacterium]